MNSCLLYVFQVHVLLFPLFRFYRSSVAFIVIEFLHVSVLVCMFVRLLSSFTGWNMELDNWRVGRQDGFLSLLLFFFFFLSYPWASLQESFMCPCFVVVFLPFCLGGG